MAAFGTVTKDANTTFYQRQMLSFGRIKLSVIGVDRGTATANFDGVALYYHLGMSVETESPPTDFRGFRIHALPYLS